MDMNVNISAIFNTLSEDQQERFIRNMLNSKENDHIQTVVFGSVPTDDGEREVLSPKSFDLRDVVDTYGEDQAVEFIKDMLTHGSVNARYVDRDAFEQMQQRLKDGNISPEERAAIEYILQHQVSNEINRKQFIGITLHFILDLIRYMQEKYNISPYYSDIMSAVYISVLGSMMHTEGTPMARFVDTNSEQNSQISKAVADDIEKVLNSTIFKDKKPNNQFLVLGLMELAERYATQDEDMRKMVYSDAGELIKYFDLEVDDEDTEDNENDKSK